MLTLCHLVEVVISGVILWSNVVSPMITTQLTNRLKAGSTLINYLYKVVITVSNDRQTDTHLVTNFKVLTSLQQYAINQDLTLNLQARWSIRDICWRLEELCIDSTPACASACLADNQIMTFRRLEINSLCSLHITQTCRRLCCLQGFVIKHQRSMLSILHQPIAIVHKCPNSIHWVQWCVPSLRTLLLQEPTLHLNKRLTISRSNGLYRLNSSHLCWNLIITPAVISVFRIEITSLLLRINRVFLNTLQVFTCLLNLTILLKDYCSIRFTIDS